VSRGAHIFTSLRSAVRSAVFRSARVSGSRKNASLMVNAYWARSLADFRVSRVRIDERGKQSRYLPLIHVPLKLFGDNEPESHCSREMPAAPFAPDDAAESGRPVRRIAAAITRASTTMTTTPQTSRRHRYRCLFFVMRSCKRYIRGQISEGCRQSRRLRCKRETPRARLTSKSAARGKKRESRVLEASARSGKQSEADRAQLRCAIGIHIAVRSWVCCN